MAATSLLALIDDIASILDDVATMTKVAAKKTTGVLGDDLALNAQQVTGIHADRELPVIWAVAKGSIRNKCVLVPAALFISAFAPWAITPLLMLGGAFLCFEGVEKLAHRHHAKAPGEAHSAPAHHASGNEQDKIAGAVRTDFILSAEIIVITLGTVASATFATQVAVLAGIALLMTVGVYGLVAGIVKLDDVGLYISRKPGTTRFARLQRWLGGRILLAAPWLMKTLSVVGTAAMFMVGGGIIVHGVATLHHMAEAAALQVGAVTGPGAWISMLVTTGFDALTGVLVGAVALTLVSLASKSLKAVRN